MLSSNRISAVLVSTDLERSQEFYEKSARPHAVCGDDQEPPRLRRRRRHHPVGLRAPSGNKAEHTQVRFWSTDIAADVAELAGRGVEFEEYDTPTFKTVDHVVTTPGIGRSAWFRDPDGNTIAIFQPE